MLLAVILAEPLPVPLLGLTEIQVGDVAFHEQLDEDAEMPMEELPPPEPNDIVPGVTVKVQGGKPASVTEKLWPAMVTVPLRA